MTEESLFDLALNTPQAERAALLDRECAGDAGLRGRVEALLAAHKEPAAWLASPHDATGPYQGQVESQVAPAEQAGALIAGRYKLLQQIGEGGMGSVWMAEQTQPVKRRVALKLIRAERGNSGTILARFEAERQAIALMDHPNVAKLLDAGTTEQGVPFFVMELVKGVPLNEFCDAHRLSVPDRLKLLMQICSAVQHAHQKGVIHRDLKPSNVLVESHDGVPVPKVIDFGLAKATSGLSLTEQTLFTAFGSVVGTPLYMAPEQATFSAIDVDTRADVYALGVILYELLTGTTPLQRESVKKAAFDELLRLIREQEPPTPSSRLSTSESKPTVAANRQSEPQKLGRFVRGELDWIVMKALSKERERRYETASGFAKDLERFLNHEPVLAGPPSQIYRLRKFVRRNRPQVIAAGLVLLALVAGVVGTTWQAIRANAARAAEADRADGEREARLEVLAAAEKEKAANEETKRHQELLFSVFQEIDVRKIKAGPDPVEAVLARRLVAVGSQLDVDAARDPVAVAALQNRLGHTLLGLGYPREAIPLFVEARRTRTQRLGADHHDTLLSMNNLATGYRDAGQFADALPLFEATLAAMKSSLGPDHPDTLACMNNLAMTYLDTRRLDKALPLFVAAQEIQKTKLGPDHPDTLTCANNLALCYYVDGKLDKAIPLYESTLKTRKVKIGPDHPDTLAITTSLATCYRDAGRLDKALPLLEQAFVASRGKLGPDHPGTLTCMNSLALAYRDAKKFDKAMPLFEAALAAMKVKFGPDHPDTLLSMNNLALGYHGAGNLDKAFALYVSTHAAMKVRLGPYHPDTLNTANNLAMIHRDAGRLDKALPLLEANYKAARDNLGTDSSVTIRSGSNLALAYRDAGRLDLALPLYEVTLEAMTAKLGPTHPDTLTAMNNLGVGYQTVEQIEKALPLLEKALDGRKAKFGPDYPDTLDSMGNLAVAYLDAKRAEDAATLLKAFTAAQRTRLGADSVAFGSLLFSVGHTLLKARQYSIAERYVRECLTIREKKDPDSWTTFNTRSMLGGSLLGQKKFAEAEALLVKGYVGMVEREDTIPLLGRARIGEAIDRLAEFYTVTKKPDKARKYRTQRAKYPDLLPPPLEEK